MINKLINRLKLILNYEISDSEVLTLEEKREKINNFFKNLSYQKHIDLFNQINDVIKDDNVPISEKVPLIKTLLECIDMYTKFFENINSFPTEIKELYFSFNSLKKVKIGIELFLQKDIVSVLNFEQILKFYIDFIDDSNNNLFINLCYEEIEKVNKKILNGLKCLDCNGSIKENLLNQDLVNQFKSMCDNLKRK